MVIVLITISLFGTIASDFGGKQLELPLSEDNNTLKDILLILKSDNERQFYTYFDEDLSPKRGTLILINGVDFNTLDGLNTKLNSSDQISLIPTISGG